MGPSSKTENYDTVTSMSKDKLVMGLMRHVKKGKLKKKMHKMPGGKMMKGDMHPDEEC